MPKTEASRCLDAAAEGGREGESTLDRVSRARESFRHPLAHTSPGWCYIPRLSIKAESRVHTHLIFETLWLGQDVRETSRTRQSIPSILPSIYRWEGDPGAPGRRSPGAFPSVPLNWHCDKQVEKQSIWY